VAQPHISFETPYEFNSRGDGKDKAGSSGPFPIGHSALPGGHVKHGSLPSARASWLPLLNHIKSYQLGLYNTAFDHVQATDANASGNEKGETRSLSFDEWLDSLSGDAHSQLSLPVATKKTISWDFMP
jgi:hypothetical protein